MAENHPRCDVLAVAARAFISTCSLTITLYRLIRKGLSCASHAIRRDPNHLTELMIDIASGPQTAGKELGRSSSTTPNW
jgi:hypothetical protein